MQELILIISRCASNKQVSKDGKHFYRFHFKGYYAGEKIKIIHLYLTNLSTIQSCLTKGDDYFLWVKRKQVREEILEVEAIKFKKIV